MSEPDVFEAQRAQLSFWLDAELLARFRAYCDSINELKGVVAEQAIAFYLEHKDPRALVPGAAGISSICPVAPGPKPNSGDDDT